jgi:signal transduction histidine kinase
LKLENRQRALTISADFSGVPRESLEQMAQLLVDIEKRVSQSAKRMGDLIDDLLAFSRIGQSEMRRTEVNLDELLRETLGDFL